MNKEIENLERKFWKILERSGKIWKVSALVLSLFNRESGKKDLACCYKCFVLTVEAA
jgi:hypothetical protein